MISIRIQPGDELPIYRQIVRQILEGIASGRIPIGSKLPSHRDLSQRLVVAPLTVKKAYDELERSGHVESRRGQGTFVIAGSGADARAERREQLRQTLRRGVSEALAAGLSLDELYEIVREEYEGLRRGGAQESDS